MSSVAEKLQRKSKQSASVKQVRLKLVYIDFWSAVKLAFLWSLSLAIVGLVVVFLVWTILNTFGIFSSLDENLGNILDSDNVGLLNIFALPKVMMFAALISALNVVVGTALGAVAALLYNFSVKMTGGLAVGFTNN